MKQQIKYVLGLDIGIGSVGWAVVRAEGEPRIEDFGVRIFDSGENSKKKERASQKRRAYRSGRRLVRRRAHRKARIRFWFQKQGIASQKEIDAFFEGDEKDIIGLRVRALDEKLEPAEIAACMIHISNHRGYSGFYDGEEDSGDEDEAENAAGVQAVCELMRAGGYRSIAEMIARDKAFEDAGKPYRRYRNRAGYSVRYVMPRDEVKKEAEAILIAQGNFYPAIDAAFREKILGILFSQRDFEDGPGDAADAHRKYSGFLDNEGSCRFYHDEKRGHRFTYLADEYALVNVLSQYRYFDEASGEMTFSSELAESLLSRAVRQGGLQMNDVKSIAKEYGLKVIAAKTDKRDSITQAMKYLKAVRPLFIKAGFDWEELISEDAADMEGCLLNRVGETLSVNITPRRRRERLKKIGRIAECKELIEDLTKLHLSGTANVSYKYMAGAVSAFLEGEIYGKFQAKAGEAAEDLEEDRHYKLKAFDKTFEFYKNPVVMRSIAQARKAINRVIEEYGSPYAINIEVGSELSKSFDARAEQMAEQAKNERARIAVKREIAGLLSIPEEGVTPVMIERYFLGEQQNWQCMYSGRPIDKVSALRNADKSYEIDHIVPFSLVLDNTLHNKVLVWHGENQAKGQRVPLEYLRGEAEDAFRKRVNLLFRGKKISEKKYNYLLAKSAYDSELIGSWKSRNLNDMRYISRFLVQYLKKNLQFRPADAQDDYRPEVYAVKGAITSQMRRLWLNRQTWGMQDKSVLKENTYLDHAADAIVVACCLPAYIEMTAVHQRLKQILKNNGGLPNAEYEGVLAAAKENIGKFYHIPATRLEYYLTQRNARPSLIRDLRREVDIRLQDADTVNFFESLRAKEEGRQARPLSEDAAADKFRMETLAFYKDDPAFAKSLHMPFTVHISSRKASGKVTDDNAVRIVENSEGTFKLSRKLVFDLTRKDMEKLYTRDEDLKASLAALFADKKEDEPLGKILAERGETEFRTQKGTPVRRVTLCDTAKRTLRKQISETNYSLLPDTSYYCVEIYRDEKGRTCAAGIAFSDIVVRGGRVRLREGFAHPEGYKEHCLYLFTNDYIRITNAKGVKFEGYYRSVYNINQAAFYYVRRNTPLRAGKYFTLAFRDTVEKLSVDPIGRIGGVIGCGEPLLSVRESE